MKHTADQVGRGWSGAGSTPSLRAWSFQQMGLTVVLSLEFDVGIKRENACEMFMKLPDT